MLFPQQNTYRAVHDLSGFWHFLPDPADSGEANAWPQAGLPEDPMLIAVPGAWNEQLAERGLMNYIGSAWYETSFHLPQFDPDSRRAFLCVGAANHQAKVWVNGKSVGGHTGGYLPFEMEITGALRTDGEANRLTVCVDSRLSMTTLPQSVDPEAAPYNRSGYDRRHVYPPTRFDFFPYGGLTRSVQVITLSRVHIQSIAVEARLDGTVRLSASCSAEQARGTVRILDGLRQVAAEAGQIQFTGGHAECTLAVSGPALWSPAHPNLYEAELRLDGESGSVCDQYREPFGFREVRVEGGKMLLNGTPLYLTGFGRHEDVPIVGHGQFRPASLRDFELMRWAGANSFRTSHYPYDEEVLRLADRLGFLVIDEVPAVSLGFTSDRFEDLAPLLQTHMRVMGELIARDLNHPCVIAWSMANEPNLWTEPHYQNDASRCYFRTMYEHVKSLDRTRPVMAVTTPAFSAEDPALDACDIIGINRYFAWYTDPAQLEKAGGKLDQEMDEIFARHGKPIVVTECGADTIEGYHATVPQMFTEEFQTEFLKIYSTVAESKPYCAGLHVWNFADFLTPQHHRRIVLNRKGVFTRSREPKGAAFFLRAYWSTLSRVADEHRPERHSDAVLIPDLKPAR